MVSAAGRRLITGTAARIRSCMPAPTPNILFPSSATEKLSLGSTPRRTWKKKVGRKIRRRRLRVECVRACGAGKIYRKANCTLGTAGGTARDVTSTIRAPVFNCRMFPSLRLDWSLGWLRFTKILLATPERQILLQNSKNMINKAFYFSEGG